MLALHAFHFPGFPSCARATLALTAALLCSGSATGAEETLRVQSDEGQAARKFQYEVIDRSIPAPIEKPGRGDFAFIVNGLGDQPNSSGRIELDAARWKKKRDSKGRVVGYRYLDRSGSRSGVTRALIEAGRITIKAKGEHWPWKPKGDVEDVVVTLEVEEARACSDFRFDDPPQGSFQASSTDGLGSCPPQLCGNAIREAGEACDDGNLNDDDGCTRACERSECGAPDFDSTFDAIQAVVFDAPALDCTNAVCHGSSMQGDLDLRDGASFDQLVGVLGPLDRVRVVPGSRGDSFLFQKLASKTLGDPADVPGSRMPIGPGVVDENALEAIGSWIDAGASDDDVVPGTGELLGVCLDEREADPDGGPADPTP